MLIKYIHSLLLPFSLAIVSMPTIAQELSKTTADFETLNKSATDSYVMTEENTTNDFGFAVTGRYQIYDVTVYDNTTGLEWQRGDTIIPTMDLEGSEQYCRNLNLDDKIDWRVPEFLELHSIVNYKPNEPGTENTSVDLIAFPETHNSYYMSSTKQRRSTDYSAQSILVNFYDGHVVIDGYKNPATLTRTRCVRGGNGLFPSFQINDNGTVTDKTRSIIWERSLEPDHQTGINAPEYCGNLEKAGLCNWRVPTVHEMASLLDFRRQRNLNYVTVFGYKKVTWMTNQVDKFNTNLFWQVQFHFDWSGPPGIRSADGIGAGHYVRCVHSAD